MNQFPSNDVPSPADIPGRAAAPPQDIEEQFHLLVDNVTDFAIFLTDTQGMIVSWNPGVERITGYTEAEFLHQRAGLLFTPEDRERGEHCKELETAAAAGRAEDERWHLKKDGLRFWGSGVMTALRDEDGNLRGFCKILRDRTEHKRAEEALQAAYEREQRIAEALQRPLTLEVPPDAFPGLTVATRYESALDEAEVGGDFFDVFALPRGRVAVAVGDASGKGLQAAARTAQVRDVLRALLREYPHQTAHTLSRLNDFLCGTKHFDDVPEEAFFTLALAVIDASTGDVVLSSAGCEPPLVLRADGSAQAVELTGLPLGIEAGELYGTTVVRLGPGDTLLLATDGITEARRGGKLLGYEGMVALARQARSAPTLRDMARAILDGARIFSNGTLRDDACLLLVRL